MSKTLTPFEEKLRQTLDHFELPYEENSWNALENKLDNKGTSNNSWIVALIAACTFVAVGSWTVYGYAFKSSSASKASSIARFENNQNVVNSSLLGSSSTTESTSNDITSEQANALANNDNALVSTPLLLADSNRNSSVVANNSPVAIPSILAENETLSASNSMVDENAPIVVSSGNSPLSVQINMKSTCAGGEIEFTALNGPKEGSYLWNFGDNCFDQRSNLKHKYTKPGVYSVSLSVTNKRDGMMTTTVMKDLITVHPSPTADFEWNFINGAMEEPTVKIVNISENASEYQWVFSDGTSSNDISPIRSYTEKGKQTILLEVSNEFGCVDKKVKYINFNEDYNLKAPEKFSPSKETFMPEGLKQGKSNFKMTIYNGEQPIYETTSKSKGWDGKLPSGSSASAGQQFPWIVIIYNEATKEEKYFSGIVTILP
jgi:PKD repeat protein